MGQNLFNKIWDLHKVGELPSGQNQIFIGLHLIHEVTSPQAFQMLRERNLKVAYPERTFATVDHIVPTENQNRPFQDSLAEEMLKALERNTKEFGIRLFDIQSGRQGIVHIIGPELGLTQPGMTIACGDSHTSTHGAFGAIAFGVGTSQIRDLLATQTLALEKPGVRRIAVSGRLSKGVFAKDVILHIIRALGVGGGKGFAYEYGGSVVENMNMEERMTLCNMSIEGGARAGYVNPDQTTFDYLKGREFSPKENEFERAISFWKSIASDPDAHYEDEVKMEGASISPMVAWGINPGQAVGIDENFPVIENFPNGDRPVLLEAYQHTGFAPGSPLAGTPIDVAFIGSCTNSRLSDLKEAAAVVKGKHIAKGIRALVVPGSQNVCESAEAEGLDEIFKAAGFEWRAPGCSMCLAMNPDKLSGREICASSSNRNFKGRQGSPTGRTLLMSPAMVAAAALSGRVTDVRELL